MDNSIEQRILQELIYERVRASVNLCQLVVLEQDLDRSIERVLLTRPHIKLPDQEGVTQSLARVYVEQAWRRLEEEWRQLRHDINVCDDPGEGAKN